MKAFAPIGRVLLALIFVLAGPKHFSQGDIAYATAAGVPLASVLVPLSGVIAILGGLMIAFGFRARLGALLLIVFLVPVTLFIHKFWGIPEEAKDMQMVQFLKNLSMLGGAFFIAAMGAGPYSFDAKAGRE